MNNKMNTSLVTQSYVNVENHLLDIQTVEYYDKDLRNIKILDGTAAQEYIRAIVVSLMNGVESSPQKCVSFLWEILSRLLIANQPWDLYPKYNKDQVDHICYVISKAKNVVITAGNGLWQDLMDLDTEDVVRAWDGSQPITHRIPVERWRKYTGTKLTVSYIEFGEDGKYFDVTAIPEGAHNDTNP